MLNVSWKPATATATQTIWVLLRTVPSEQFMELNQHLAVHHKSDIKPMMPPCHFAKQNLQISYWFLICPILVHICSPENMQTLLIKHMSASKLIFLLRSKKLSSQKSFNCWICDVVKKVTIEREREKKATNISEWIINSYSRIIIWFPTKCYTNHKISSSFQLKHPYAFLHKHNVFAYHICVDSSSFCFEKRLPYFG